MKRTISLVLCLTILLGLLTGLAGATETPQEFSDLILVSDMTENTGYFGSRGFALKLQNPNKPNDEGILVPNNDPDYNVYFSNPLLGTLEKTDPDKEWAAELPWTWSSENAVPDKNGLIVVEYGGKRYTVPVSNATPELALYRENGSMITGSNRDLVYVNGKTATVRVKVEEEGFALDKVEARILYWDENDNEIVSQEGCSVSEIVNGEALVTVSGLYGEYQLIITATYGHNSWDEPDERDYYIWLRGEDSDVLRYTGSLKTEIEQFNGGQGFNLYLKDEEGSEILLTEDNAEVWFTNDGLGEVFPWADDGESNWMYDLWPLEPDQQGYLVAEYNGARYYLYFSTTMADIGLFTDISCHPDSYLVKSPVQSLEYMPGEPITIYAYTQGHETDDPTIVRGDDDYVTFGDVIFDQRVPITFTAPENASGTYFYEFEWDGMCLEVEFTAPDTSTLRAVGDEGGRLNLLNQRLPGQMSFLLQYKDENGEWKYLDGNQAKVYFAGPNPGGALETTDFLGTIFFNGTYWIWDTQTAYQNSRAFLCAELPGSETVYMTEVSTRSASFGMYDENNRYMPSSNIGYIVSYTSGAAKELQLRFDENFFTNNVDVEQLEMSGTSTTPQIKVTPDKANGTISVSYDGTPMSGMQVVVLHGSFNQGGFELIIRFVDSVTTPELNTTIPEEVGYVLGEWDTPNASLAHYRHQELTINGETYYLSPGSLSIPTCDQVGPANTGTSMWESGKQWFQFAPIIYQKINGSDVPIADPSKLGVSDLQLRIYAMPNGTDYDLNGARVSQKMPKVYDGPTWYPGSQGYEFDVDSQGAYLVVASAMVGGQKYYSYATCYLISRQSEVVAVRTVEEANAVMRNHPIMGMRDHLVLSFVGETELEGTIYVPDGMSVTLTSGTWERITLHGGIESDGMAGVTDFNFVGAGNDEELTTWPEGNEHGIPAGTPNYALYGKGPAGASNCSFTGYYTAMRVEDDAHMLNFGGEFNVFQDNYIAIYVDYHGQDGGLGLREGLQFIANDTAIYIDYLSESLNMNFLQLTNAWFINNGVDIRNDSNRLYWLPMCYFIHDDRVDLQNPCHHSNVHSTHWQPVTEGNLNNNKKTPSVIASPAAVDPTFESKEYYYPKHVYVYPAMKDLYPVEYLYENMKVTALSEDENEIATLALDKISAAPVLFAVNSNGPTNLDGPQYPGNQGGPSSEPESNYDPLMIREDEDGKVQLTLKAIPEGYTATVEVPCEGWTEAVVMFGEKVVEGVTVQNGIITFPAQTSDAATYTIIRDNFVSELTVQQNGTEVEDPEALPVGEFQLTGKVDVTAALENTAVIMVAGYTKEGKMVLSEIPVLKDGAFDLTINNTGNLHNLKVFLLNSMENLLPINGAQKIGKP